MAMLQSMGQPSHISTKEEQKTPILYQFEEANKIKDSYSLHMIEDTMDSLNEAIWLTALDLKSGYWQVKMDKASKALMAFTVGLLQFYICDCMPLGLLNAPPTFQRLMGTCMGDLQLNWCISISTTSSCFLKYQRIT